MANETGDQQSVEALLKASKKLSLFLDDEDTEGMSFMVTAVS